MSIQNSEREFIFTFWQKENLNVLNDELGIKLTEPKLEKQKFRRKIDMYAIDALTGKEVFIENTLYISDNSHQKQLLSLITEMDGGIIVYQAIKFKEKHIKSLETTVQEARKPISVILIEINEELLPVLDDLNRNTHKLKVYGRLAELNSVQNPIKVLKRIESGHRYLPTYSGIEFTIEKREQENLYLLERLKKDISYFFSFQRHKSNISTNRVLSFGMGRSDVSMFISLENMRKQAVVEIKTGRDTELYKTLKQEAGKANMLLGDILMLKDKTNTISYHFKPYSDIEKTADRIVEVAECFIKVFIDKILYPNGEFRLESH